MPTPKVLTTARLILRPLAVDDAAALYSVYGHAETVRFWHEPPYSDVAITRARIATALAGPGCWWALCLPGADRAIGVINYLGTDGRPGMGYILHHAWWRQGYMTEAAQAVLTYGFERLGLDGVELWVHRQNWASRRLAARLGFTGRSRFPQDGGRETVSAHKSWVK